MAGTSEGGRKAAQTREHESLSKAGQKGGEHSQTGKGSTNQQREDERTRSGSGSQQR